MRLVTAAFCAFAALFGAAAHAAVANHIYDYTWDGANPAVANQSAAGAQLLNGEAVQLTLRALGNDYFTSDGTFIWVPLAMGESATRVGDLSAVFRLDGVPVGTATYTGQNHAFVHIANFLNPAATMFDEVEWVYLSTSSNAQVNTLGGLLNTVNPFIASSIGDVQYVNVPDGAVPSPGSLSIAALGLMALAARRRQR